MGLNEAISAFVALFIIIDPIGLTPLFVALTRGATAEMRRRIAARAVLIAAVILALFGLFGEEVLSFVGISMPAFRIAGGLLLFLTAIEMLFERRTQRREKNAVLTDDPSVFPLATPLIAGPGAITTMILFAGRSHAPTDYLVLGAAMLAVLMLVLVLFFAGSFLERLLGHTGINVVTRLLGMLLAALSVQFVLDGLRDFGLVPGGGG